MTASQRSVCVLGGGSFGSTIARLVGAVAADAPVRWWVREAEVADEINTHRSNERFLPGAVFTPNLVAMTDLEAATAGATHLVVAIPSQFLEATLPRVRKHIRADASVLSVVKSLHYEDARNRLSLPSSEILQLLGGTHEVCVLCGPNIYHEMTSDASFAEATIGCADSVSGRVAAAQWHALLMADNFATRCIADRSGVEAAGALKNVIALGTGFGTGCGHGANVRAAIMRVGLGEMERFARRFLGAADARTFYEEACGVGDLVLTCTTGRGHQLAAAFVRGDEHTRDVQTPHARWAALEAKLFPGMCLPDWHSAKALKAFLAAHCAEHAFPLLCAIGRISHGREPAAHIVGVVREAVRGDGATPAGSRTLRETLPAAPAVPDDPARRPTRRHRWLLWPLLAAVVAALPLLPVEVWLPHMDLPSEDLSSTADPLPPLSPADVPSFLNATCLNSERRFPLVVKPADPFVSIERVSEWVERNRDIVTGWLEAYGAVLMRGFAVEEAAQFERFAMAYTDRLDNIYLGTSPRESVNNFVFTASEFESWKVVPMHCEMSFLPRPPEHLFFFAKEMPPDMVGGESPLVDMRAVAREMGEATRAAFERKGIRYVRAYPSARSSHPLDKYDPFKTKSYEAMFRHVPSDAAAVEAESRRQGFTPSWGPRGILKLTHEMPAFRTHPRTGDEVWYNHLGVLHSASWADEFAHAARHLRSSRYATLSWLFYALDALAHRALGGEALSQHVTHRGGEPIAAEHVWHVRRLMWKHTLTAPWRQGDIILVDNFRLGHARMPFSTAGKRRLWAIWTKPPASLE